MSKNTGGPAYPQGCDRIVAELSIKGSQGMTLRDHFAGLAMQGLIAEGPCGAMESVAYDSYRMADAMLTEREKGDE